MTRVLSELLGAREPAFQQAIRRLEAVSGHTNADIRLTTEVERATRAKLKALGLDPMDTTGEELYGALQERIRADDAHLLVTLQARHGKAGSVQQQIASALNELPVYKGCFALKTTIGRKLLKKQPPKQTMKALGYRSFDSMMRREQLLAVYAAAWLLESATWRKAMIEAYKKLSASDFELRPLAVLAPSSKHWQSLAKTVVSQRKHTVIGLREFGAVVLLPFTDSMPPAAAIATLLMALNEINTVRSGSTYLKLCQVRRDFGDCVQMVVASEPTLPAEVLDGQVQWHVVQRYYARHLGKFRDDLFEPHIQKEDLSWHSIEKALTFVDPDITFWQHTAMLGVLDAHRPVSCNVLDVSLNYCNQWSYRARISHHLQRSLWSELVIRYLKHESVEQAVIDSLEARLVPDIAADELDYQLA